MTDSQRNCFLAVAEYRSFSRAASALYVSQPAVSKNISTLEAEIGVPLFDRQGKYVMLTKAGEIFLSFLTEYSREYEAMMKRIRSLGHNTPYGTVRIGCGLTWNAAHFHTRLARHFAIHFPGIQLEVEGLDPEAFLPALRRKEVDIMLMYAYDLERQQDIESHRLIDIGTGFLCSSLLSKDRPLSIRALGRYPFLVAESPSDRRNSNTYKDIIGDICKSHGINPEFAYCRSLGSGIVDLSCGKGSLLVDDWTAATSNSEFCYIPTGETIPVSMAWLPNGTDQLLRLVIDEIIKVFEHNY